MSVGDRELDERVAGDESPRPPAGVRELAAMAAPVPLAAGVVALPAVSAPPPPAGDAGEVAEDARLGPPDAALQQQFVVNGAGGVVVEALPKGLAEVVEAEVRRAPLVGPVQERTVVPAIRHKGRLC